MMKSMQGASADQRSDVGSLKCSVVKIFVMVVIFFALRIQWFGFMSRPFWCHGCVLFDFAVSVEANAMRLMPY